MKLTRRQLMKTLSYAAPVLAIGRMNAFAISKPGFALAGDAMTEGAVSDRLPDLVVYGGTSSGVMAAYSAAREGLRVVLLEPGAHLGGMVTGGLSCTDLGHYGIIGGYVRDFYLKAAVHYGVHDLDRMENWILRAACGGGNIS